jgi:hypothetical protein
MPATAIQIARPSAPQSRAPATPAAAPRLLDQLRREIRLRHYLIFPERARPLHRVARSLRRAGCTLAALSTCLAHFWGHWRG